MKKWLKRFEDIMAASAYAEAGEFETAKDTFREQRKILLALSGRSSDMNAFRYAVNACKRVGAGLEIMYGPEARDSLKRLQSELQREGIEYSSIKRKGRLEEEIQLYTEKRNNILFVVIEAPSEAGVSSKKAGRKFERAWDKLKCPLVTVSRPSAA